MPRPALRFDCRGISLAHPVDRMPEGYFPHLQNVRVMEKGQLDVRQGLAKSIEIGGGAIHSLRRVNNDVDSTSARYFGIASKLYRNADFLEDGFSGDPFSFLPFRPNKSPYPYLYIGNSAKMRKVDTKGNSYQIGIRPPSLPPTISMEAPNFVVIADFEAGGWVSGGTAGTLAVESRFDTTISRAVIDGDGWASLVPASTDGNLQPGAKVVIGVGADAWTTKIEEALEAIPKTSIASIMYDRGTTGTCAIVLRDVSPNLYPNSVVDIDGEYVRVEDVISGEDGVSTIRCSTPHTHSPGDPITGHPSFRAFIGNLNVVGMAMHSNFFTYSNATGEGTLSYTAARDFSILDPDGEGGRPSSADDYMHVSIGFDNPVNLTEIKVMMDIGDGSFTQNYLYKSFTFADFSGASQWNELFWKLSEMTRVGNDPNKSIATVSAIGIYVKALHTIQVRLAGWWVGGTYGVDVTNVDASIQYAYRYRDSRTGARSNLSPATRTGLNPQRNRIYVACLESVDRQIDTIDIFRFGGGLNSWVMVGAHPNVSDVYADDLSTIAIQGNEVAPFDDYMPFPISDLPRMGTCNICGTSVEWTGGDKFNLDWVPGSLVIVNGKVCTLYAPPFSPTRLSIVQSAGIGSNVPFSLPEPTIAGQPLPAIWSYGGQGTGTFVFGVGDKYNPGFLRWCKGNDADSASDTGNLEVTSPSEPLMNGCEYDGRAFVFSTERMFAIFPNFGTINFGGIGQSVSSSSGNMFTAQNVENGAGLFTRFGMVVTPYGIAWISKDGVYLFTGGQPKNITNDTLYPLFPHGGTEAGPVNGYYPPDFSQPNLLHLSFADNSLFFTYPDTQGKWQCLRYDFAVGGWFPYSFSPSAIRLYQEEGKGANSVLVGGADGNVYQFQSEPTDNGADISCHVRTPSMDLGDSRSLKYFTDSILDHQGILTQQIGFNNHQLTLGAGKVTQAIRNQSIIPIAISDGDTLRLYRNISLDLVWTGAATLFEFQPNGFIQSLVATGLVAQYTDHGIPGFTHGKEAWVTMISSTDATLEIWVDGVLHQFLVPSTKGRFLRQHLLLAPLKGQQFMYRLVCSQPFIPFPEEIIMMVKRWGGDTAFMPYHPFQPNLNTLGEGRAFTSGIPV